MMAIDPVNTIFKVSYNDKSKANPAVILPKGITKDRIRVNGVGEIGRLYNFQVSFPWLFHRILETLKIWFLVPKNFIASGFPQN